MKAEGTEGIRAIFWAFRNFCFIVRLIWCNGSTEKLWSVDLSHRAGEKQKVHEGNFKAPRCRWWRQWNAMLIRLGIYFSAEQLKLVLSCRLRANPKFSTTVRAGDKYWNSSCLRCLLVFPLIVHQTYRICGSIIIRSISFESPIK